MGNSPESIHSDPPPAGGPAEAAKPAPPGGHASVRRRGSELALVIGFLLIIGAVPVTQTGIELARGDRVQFTDVFRYRPTSKNLRQYEATLKEKSWFQQRLGPEAQRLLFATLSDTGAKGMLGRDDWLFYRPDVRYLVEPNRAEPEDSSTKWLRRTARLSQREGVTKAILAFRDQLKERGIALLVVPVPGKPSIYPDRLTRRESANPRRFRSPTVDLIQSLREQGVETIDLFSLFQNFRSTNQTPSADLYLARDTHWTPLGARLAAEAVASRVRELGFAPTNHIAFETHAVPVSRWGDILEMMQIPGLRDSFAPEPITCEQVTDPVLGPLLPSGSERPGACRYPGAKTTVLVLGDSFTRVYQYAEPQSLGGLPAGGSPAPAPESGAKRLLPGSAGFVSHLALALRAPVDAIYSDGGASTDVRRKLSTNPEILEDKQVVIWEFVERDIALGQQGWEEVPLPVQLK